MPTLLATPRRRLVAGLAVVVALWGAAVGQAALSARGDLLAARVSIESARSAVGQGEYGLVQSHLDEADTRLDEARSALRRPDVALAVRVPVVGRSLRSVRAIADGAGEVVAAGEGAVVGVRALAARELTPGRLPVDALAELAPALGTTARAAAGAVDAVTASPDRLLIPAVARARTEFLDLLEPVARDLDVAASLADTLPGFLGADGPRAYLLFAANPAELRGLPGYLGAFAEVTLDDGRLEVGRFAALNDLPDLRIDQVDPGLLPERYAAFGSTYRWKNAAMTPDFPAAARTLEAMWQAHTGRELDGLIVVDPFALAALLEVTGPVDAGELGVTLGADDAVDFLTNEAYERFEDADERKVVLGEVSKTVLDRFLASGSDTLSQLGELASVVSDRHLLLHAADADTQTAFEAAGIAGAFDPGDRDFVAVVANSATNAKLDYYLERSLRYEVELVDGGAVVGDLTVTFANDAPTSGLDRYIIGPNVAGLRPGENRFFLSTYCARGCELLAGEGGTTGIAREVEDGLSVGSAWVELPSGATETLTYAWRAEDVWHRDGERLVYELIIRTQTAVRAPTVEVVVGVPPDFVVDEAPGGAEVDGDRVRWRSTARGDVRLAFVFSPDGGS